MYTPVVDGGSRSSVRGSLLGVVSIDVDAARFDEGPAVSENF